MIDARKDLTTFASSVCIETGSKCNRRCVFCPVSAAPREDEWMPDEMFDHIIDQLAAMDFKKRIELYSYNEPVRDKRLPDMIRRVRAKLPRACIMINTNGDYFKDKSDVVALFLAGLNQMQINIYSAQDGCGDPVRIASGNENAAKRFKLIKGWIDETIWLDQEASLYNYISPNKQACQVIPKWNLQPEHHSHGMPAKEHGTSVIHHISNRAGNVPHFVAATPEPLDKMCTRPFRIFTINWRGDSILCCNDYHGEASSGNVSDRTLIELWNDTRWHAYRVKLRLKDRKIFLCDKCDYNGGFYQHNVAHVTFGPERDVELVMADMRSREAAGFTSSLVQITKRSE